jgi:hypothetical protein
MTISEMQVIHLAVEKGAKTDLVFTMPNTAVLFGSTADFSGLVSLGHSAVRHFGSIGVQSDAVGVFFGDDLGKIRILGHETFEFLIYALVPPVECSGYWITTAPSGIFSIGLPDGNATDEPSICCWHIHPQPRTYITMRHNLQPTDVLFVYESAHRKVDVRISPISFNVSIVLIHYRPQRKANGRSVQVTFSGDSNVSFFYSAFSKLVVQCLRQAYSISMVL